MVAGRRADIQRRRPRVLKAFTDAITSGEEVTTSGLARRAGADRTFLHRHRNLLELVHTAEAQPRNGSVVGPTVSRASLQAGLHAAQQRTTRLAAQVQQLQTRLSDR